MAEGILFRFANEEMIYLLRSLHIPHFPGIVPEPLNPLVDEEKSLLMTEADHTLRARGLVRWLSETERQVAPPITELLLECAQPRYTLFVDMLDANATATKLLYIFGQEVIVEQCEPEPQVQQYLVIPSREAFSQRLESLVVPEQDEAFAGTPQESPCSQISLDLWERVLKVARADQAGAGVLLARSLPNQMANALAASIHDFQHIRYLGLWKQVPSSTWDHPETALTVVAGHGQIFLLWQEKPDSPLLRVIFASTQLVQEYIVQLLLPAV
ncbi:MAG: hypothetical protein ACRDHW_02930 [Ktedonobacteraceae bacterium]